VRNTGRVNVPTLRDGDLLLRPKLPGDADALTAACQDPEISRWTLVPSPYTRADADHFIAISEQEAAAGTAVHLIAVDAEDGRLLGSFSVMELDREPGYGEIGYWVAKEARGKGVASRAVVLLRDYAVTELGLEVIELIIHEGNTLSQRVAERTGFLDIGEKRIAPRQEGGTARDHMVYAWTAS
jgi:RimJ/RimL family protein N-acetyltransferase